MIFRRPRRARSEHYQRRMRTSGLAPVWRSAAIGSGLSVGVSTPSGTTQTFPELVDVGSSFDGDPVLTVRLLPGQLPADVMAAASRLAPALGFPRLTVAPLGLAYVRVQLLAHDPLADVVSLPPVIPPGLIGYGEDGDLIAVPVPRRPHAVVQGQTGSGKSVWTYGQLSGAAVDPCVLVAGIDPTGLLFRPFAGSRHASWQCSGVTGDLAEHVDLLERLTAEMDRRIRAMPANRDAVECSPELPALLVVLEEYAGLLRAADLAGKATGQRVRALVARLLSEGRKAGVRVLLIVQRADAAVVDGLARAQCGLRVSFSVDSREAVAMLHPAVVDVADVLAAPPGVALMTAPGRPLVRFRAPLIGAEPFAAYVQAVSAAVASDGLSDGPEGHADGPTAA